MPCIRQDDAPKDAPIADAERLRRMNHAAVECLECAARRAVHERKTHDDRCDDRRTPRKDERQVDGEEGASDGTALSEKEQEEEPNDGRRQDERQSNHSIGNGRRDMAADTQYAVGEPNTDEEGEDSSKPRHLKGDDEWGECFVCHYLTVNPYFSKTLAALSVWRKARNSFAAISFLEFFSTAAG